MSRATDDATRARLLARLARELLGDPLAGGRRRALTDEALRLARAAADAQALAAYRRRLLELEVELQDADAAGDVGRSERAEAERLVVLAELRRSTSLGGRSRAISAEAERARVNVTRTLRAVLKRLEAHAPQAAAHLRASIRTGLSCRYDPAPGGPTGWHI